MKKIIRLFLCVLLVISALTVSAFAAETGGIIGSADGPTAILISPAPTDIDYKIMPISAIPEEISVMLNGEFVNFTDAVPEITNDRTFIPLRTVLNALGIEDDSITYDSETKTVTAVRGDTTITLTIGQNAITVIKDGKRETIETDAAAYIANDRTLVPVRFVAEALGCNVGWDSYRRTVIIDDVETVLSENTETYELINGLLAYSEKFSQTNHALNGTIKGSISVEGEELSELSAKLNGTITGLTSQTAADMDINMTVSGYYKEGASTLPLTAFNIPAEPYYSLRYDLESGTMAYKTNYTNIAYYLIGQYGLNTSDIWILYDLNAMLEKEGVDFLSLTSFDAESFEDIFELIVRNLDLTSVYGATSAGLLAEVNSLLADSAFTKNGTTYTSTLAIDEGELKFNIYTSLGSVNGYGISFSYVDVEYDMMSVSADLTAKGNNLSFKFAVTSLDKDLTRDRGFEVMDIDIEMNVTVSSTSRSPVGKPGEDEYVLDPYDMYSNYDYLY